MRARFVPALLALPLGLVAVGAIALPVPTQGVRPQLQTQQSVDRSGLRDAVEALKAGRNDDAKRGFEAAQRANPQAVEPVLGLAELALRSKNEAEALRQLQRAQSLAPQRADVQVALGRLHLLRGAPDKAEPALREAVKLDAKGVPQRVMLAELLMRRGDAKAALPLLQQARELKPDDAGVLLGLGSLQLRSGDRAGGEALLRRAAELDPQNPVAWLELAQAATDAPTGLKLVDEAAKRAPERLDVHLMRARWQLQAKDEAGARKSLQRAAQVDPKAAEPWLRLGLLDEAAGRRAEAKRNYLATIERDAFQPVALNNLVMMGLADGDDPVRLETMARRALKALPDLAPVHDTLARVLRARKDKKGALAAAQNAARLAPQDPAMKLLLAEMQQWNGDRAAARQSAEAVLTLQAKGEVADQARALLAKL